MYYLMCVLCGIKLDNVFQCVCVCKFLPCVFIHVLLNVISNPTNVCVNVRVFDGCSLCCVCVCV